MYWKKKKKKKKKKRGERRREGRRREGRDGLSGNVTEEAFCLKSAPGSGITGAGLASMPASFHTVTYDQYGHLIISNYFTMTVGCAVERSIIKLK